MLFSASADTLWSWNGETGRRGREKNASTPLSPLPRTSAAVGAEAAASWGDPVQTGTISGGESVTAAHTPDSAAALWNALTGAGAEDPQLPGADRLAALQVQDADGQGQARHHAADGERGGGPLRQRGRAERRGARRSRAHRRRQRRQAAPGPPLRCHGEWPSQASTEGPSGLPGGFLVSVSFD